MTNLNPDSTNRDDHGLGWVTLAEGVDMSRTWLAAHTPHLFTAWQQTQNAQQRLQIAQQIQQVAAEAESDRGQGAGEDRHDPSNEYVNLRIQWAETTRYEADFYLSPYSTDEQLWSEIGLAHSIDSRLTEGSDWAALAAALDRAAASGYDVAANLPRLAAEAALPDRHPARELLYRLMADCDAALVSAGDAGDASAASSDNSNGPGTRAPDLAPPSAAPGDAPTR